MAEFSELGARSLIWKRINVHGAEVAAAIVGDEIFVVTRGKSNAEQVFRILDEHLADDDCATVHYDNGGIKSWRSSDG